ncbi:MAG: DUF2459 domain-containing protein [Bacteroidales bacterium]|nr:DUF2459 domain-containing protein [Bacteroidales bacterium]
MRNGLHIVPGFLLMGAVFLSGCFAPKEGLYPPSEESGDHVTVHFIKRSWHTGLLVKKNAVDTLMPDLTRDVTKAEYLNISWGDKEFFMADVGTVGLALRAAFLPTQSVIQVNGYPELSDWYFDREEVEEIELSRRGFDLMIDYIHESFARDSMDNLVPLRERRTGMSYFYLSNITFWGTRTCNVWTAKALRQSGFPINPYLSLTAGSVMRKVRRNQ